MNANLLVACALCGIVAKYRGFFRAALWSISAQAIKGLIKINLYYEIKIEFISHQIGK